MRPHLQDEDRRGQNRRDGEIAGQLTAFGFFFGVVIDLGLVFAPVAAAITFGLVARVRDCRDDGRSIGGSLDGGLSAARLTTALVTPGTALSAFRHVPRREAQVMPSIATSSEAAAGAVKLAETA